ncbi:pentapeptide repeat-containing protein [Streptomyces sp. So13.3]|uniref:pentapeptide repeat-containing protein n=2 Tax=Streptomyces TaxID=1883 RepID=UPI00110706B0|nr:MULTISPECIES: pentapeptide repeat-containing protein [Streptomyces]MCZ4099712.1 pentapeptide repeat-containing protein [Streptomyces sp. H39-C1]QNA70963.1 pentapeptide repeat-containing protein [Streptomyces sp. So13.3]
MSAPPTPVPLTPGWPHCGHGADPAHDPIGCRGVHTPGSTACLAHLADADRAAHLAGLTSGSDVDLRGTPLTRSLLNQVLDAVRDPATGNPHFGSAYFAEATFRENVRFNGARFTGPAWFHGARFTGQARFREVQFHDAVWFTEAQFSKSVWFSGTRFMKDAWFDGTRFVEDAAFDMAQFTEDAHFDRAEFSGPAGFRETRFSENAWFSEAEFAVNASFDTACFTKGARFLDARFSGEAGFDGVQFSGDAQFDGAQFAGDAQFLATQFTGEAGFDGAQFSGDARFSSARFAAASSFGPVLCARTVNLSGAVFETPVTLEIAARRVDYVRTRWEATMTMRLRYAAVDLSHAVLSAPAAVTAHPAPFAYRAPSGESLLAGAAPQATVQSVQGVDAAHLVLTDTDLTKCLFSGAFHLDQLRLEGRCTLAPAPAGWHLRGIWPYRWTRRRTLAEEHHWRARNAGQPAPVAGRPPSARVWSEGPHHPDPGLTPDPEDVAALYRQLRKAFEDGKNEPGAADFYYGEMEMRRHDRASTPRGERGLLWGYWLLSGYGLRSSRALAWLLAAMSVTILLLSGFGLPDHDPDPATTGTLRGSAISLTTSSPDPSLRGSLSRRMTAARTEKATRVAVNSVVFRSSGQNLTTAGTYIEMTSRLLEPILLALAALAVRGRIKR